MDKERKTSEHARGEDLPGIHDRKGGPDPPKDLKRIDREIEELRSSTAIDTTSVTQQVKPAIQVA